MFKVFTSKEKPSTGLSIYLLKVCFPESQKSIQHTTSFICEQHDRSVDLAGSMCVLGCKKRVTSLPIQSNIRPSLSTFTHMCDQSLVRLFVFAATSCPFLKAFPDTAVRPDCRQQRPVPQIF